MEAAGLGTELGDQIALLKAPLFHEEPHHRDRIGRRDWVMLLLVAFHQQSQQFDGLRFGG